MKLEVPPPEVAHAGLRALHTIAAADGEMHELERGLLESVQSLLLRTDHDVASLGLIGPRELAEAVPKGIFRERIIRGCTLMALVDGEASEDEEGILDDYAGALEVDTAPLADFKLLAAAYQAGFQQYDPFFSLLFVICQFHLGIQISPIAGTETMKMEPQTMLEAFLRGTQCTRDLSDGWDPWEHFPETVDELRAKYSIDVRVPPPR